MLRLGGPVGVTSGDVVELARRHRELGYRAAYCPPVTLDDADGIALARNAFEEAGVVIAEVGAWVNLLDADPAKRKANLAYVTAQMALADEVGALCCVDIVGSFNPDHWDGPHPLNLAKECFDAAVENARAIIDAVKPRTTQFCYEMMPHTVPDSVDSFVQLVRAVDRKGFGVHLDPVNIISSPQRYYGNADILIDAFRMLGPWIVSCHAKDTLIKPALTVCIEEARPGQGNLDYRTYLTELSKLPQAPPLMLEHLATEAEYDAARGFIFGVAESLGLAV